MIYSSLIIVFLVIALSACTSLNQNEMNENPQNASALYSLPDKIDHEKAAKLNIELGLNYLKQEQITRAKAKLTHAKMLAPQLPEVHYAYGYFLETVGEIEQAEKSYLKAISLYPRGGIEHNNYGTFLCRQGKYRLAEKEFLLAINDPHYLNTAEALENAGLCVLQVPDSVKAAKYFEKALRYDPKRVNALIELATLSCQQKNKTLAKAYLERYLAIAKPTARTNQLKQQIAESP
ncbi:MAG: type IV pilus biogenesis/stability protein PilW [Candidatus Berkiellales bacterium]